ncbi:MAG TPA: glycosyltransferase family 4 protein [Flavobacterium sp.]|nr:glycosyltransferase family 4 protein [Flavobacterium sp.]
MKKVIRTSTVALSLDILLKGQLKFLSGYYEIVAVSGNDNHLQAVENREGVRTIDVPIQRKISPWNDLVSLYKLYKVFKKERPFIVHSITPKAGLLSMVAAYFAKVPVRIHTFTGLIFPNKTGLMQKTLILMDKMLCAFATDIYPEGQGVKADLIRYKITSKPLHIIANGNVNGIDVDYFDPSLFTDTENASLRQSLGISANEFVFIFVGRLVKDKGINELVAAFSKLHSNCKLLLVGPIEPELDPLLPETLREIDSNKNILTTGYQTDVRPYFAIADSLVFPSHREGFPNVVLQAGAMELPCIVTDINGSNEIIENGKNGLIIPVKNENAILEAMKKLMANSEMQAEMRQNARPKIVSRFRQNVVWDGILAEYRKFESHV